MKTDKKKTAEPFPPDKTPVPPQVINPKERLNEKGDAEEERNKGGNKK